MQGSVSKRNPRRLLLWLDPGVLDNRGELHDLGLHERLELTDRHRRDLSAGIDELGLDVWLLQDAVDLGIEPPNDLAGRTLRREEALPERNVEVADTASLRHRRHL